jgi:hypothetical protein
MEATQDDDTGMHDGDYGEDPRLLSADPNAEVSGGSGWVTTEVAAAALGVTPRTIREYIKTERLGAKATGEGVNKTWSVSIDDVQRLRESRRGSADSTRKNRGEVDRVKLADTSAADAGEALRDLITRLEVRTAEAADYKARLELTAQAESTLREALERERERADKAERRAEELEAKLAGTTEPQATPETTEVVVGGGDDASLKLQEPPERRSWLYRFFFGP